MITPVPPEIRTDDITTTEGRTVSMSSIRTRTAGRIGTQYRRTRCPRTGITARVTERTTPTYRAARSCGCRCQLSDGGIRSRRLHSDRWDPIPEQPGHSTAPAFSLDWSLALLSGHLERNMAMQ